MIFKRSLSYLKFLFVLAQLRAAVKGVSRKISRGGGNRIKDRK